MGSREFYAHIWALRRHFGHMAYMLDSDWLKKFLLRSDWLGPSVALYTTTLLLTVPTLQVNLLFLQYNQGRNAAMRPVNASLQSMFWAC